MKICRKCGAKYPDNEEICSIDGQKLHTLPDFLANRPSPSTSTSSSRKTADPFIGKHIEKYKIIGKIGEGGMGIVYKAEHIHIGKKVALKILREDYTKKQDVVERFKQEARSASIIGHPNIIDVTDFGYTHDGRVFFVMELLGGEDMATILENDRILDYKRAIKISRQICHALNAAHKKGIIHRDMKPENIFITDPGTREEKIKILDFGIAKMSVLDQEGRKLTRTGVVFGTPEYMSPEQAAGKPVDNKIDIYALGIILYEMLTGKVPFTGDTFMSILSKHIFENVPPLKEACPGLDIPEALEKLIYKCLEKEPENRIGSAEELANILESIGKDEEITMEIFETPKGRSTSGTTPGPVLEVIGEGDVPSPLKRRPLAFLTVVLILVPLLMISGLVYFKLYKSNTTNTNSDTGGFTASGHGAAADPMVMHTVEKKSKENEGGGQNETMDDNAAHNLVTPHEIEKVSVRVNTTPGGAIVEVKGQGQKCPATPCDFETTRGKEITLIVKRGNFELIKTITPIENPTEVECRLGKPYKKGPEKGDGAKGNGAWKVPEKDKAKATKTNKIKNIDSGDLKTPDIFRDK